MVYCVFVWDFDMFFLQREYSLFHYRNHIMCMSCLMEFWVWGHGLWPHLILKFLLSKLDVVSKQCNTLVVCGRKDRNRSFFKTDACIIQDGGMEKSTSVLDHNFETVMYTQACYFGFLL